MVGKISASYARAGVQTILRQLVARAGTYTREHPQNWTPAQVAVGIATLETLIRCLDTVGANPVECQNLVWSFRLQATDLQSNLQSLESSLSVRDAAKPRPPEGSA